jgi:hypothetical protein
MANARMPIGVWRKYKITWSPGDFCLSPYSIDKYTFPKEAYIHDVTFDEKYLHVELTEERVISILMIWFPTVYYKSDID